MRAYRLRRQPERKVQAIAYLGGQCAHCGAVENLQFDHIVPSLKSFDVLTVGYSLSWERLRIELDKCQLLCVACHITKSVTERGQQLARGTHGTLSAYRHCGPPKCDECKAAKATFARSYPSPSRMKK